MTLVFSVAGALVLGALLILWWSRRDRSVRSRLAGVATMLGALLLVFGVAGVALGVWALAATDTSQLARAIAWGDSNVDDIARFPSRTIRAGDDPVRFNRVAGSPLEGFRPDETGETLERVLEATETTAFIVLHGDDLLYEGYFNGSSREATQTSFSVAKSFTATLVGVAIDEGLISGLDDPVTEYVPELGERDPRFRDITLRHLITMSSGLAFREGASPWDDPANTYHGTDLRSAALTQTEIEKPPGGEFHYNDWNLLLMGIVLERSTGMSLSAYMETRLWRPMGAEADGSWSLDSEASGFEKVFVGINARAIDFAKLGWLYLNDGRNGADQVVPAEFIEEATRIDTTTDPASHYQYYWWIDEARNSYFANGDHGQNIYVDPHAGLVLVRHAREGGNIDWIKLFGDLADWLGPQLPIG